MHSHHETLAQALSPHRVEMAQLRRDYGPLLELVRVLIGVVPNCDPYLEIWPPAFRAYNLLVPNLLNLPELLFGWGAPKALVGLAMYASSRSAECMYCSAHCCSFAMRRGIGAAALQGTGQRNAVQQSVWTLAHELSVSPQRLQREHVQAVARHLSRRDLEWVVWSVSLMGFLNKLMDALGIELEPAALGDAQAVLLETGWTPGKHLWRTGVASAEEVHTAEPSPLAPTGAPPVDSWRTYMRVVRQAPAALRYQKRWLSPMGSTSDGALSVLRACTHHDFSHLRGFQHSRPVVAVAAVLRDQLDPNHSCLGREAKCVLGWVFATQLNNPRLIAEMEALLQLHAPGMGSQGRAALSAYAKNPVAGTPAPAELPPHMRQLLTLARLSAGSPAALLPEHIDQAVAALSPEQIIETITWLAVVQLLHRLYSAAEFLDEGPS